MNLRRVSAGPLLSLVFLMFFGCMVFGVKWVFDNSLQINQQGALLGSISEGVQVAVAQNTPENIVKPVTVAAVPNINAESAISVENDFKGGSKILFDKNSDKQLSIASLTKLMTAIVALDNYNLSDNVEVDQVADSQDPMKQDVKLGDTMPAENFLDIMLVESSNKSAYALSELAGEARFVEMMNEKAKQIGLQNTYFVDPTGLSSRDVSTASDLVKLAEYILKNYPKIADISKNTSMKVPGFGNVENTDQLLTEIPDIICSKTGFTDAAKGCLLLVINNQKNNDYLINVVLGADDRFSDMKNLVNWSNTICK